MNILVPSGKSIVSYQGILTVFYHQNSKKIFTGGKCEYCLIFILSDNETLDTITYIHANFLENIISLPLNGIVPNRH